MQFSQNHGLFKPVFALFVILGFALSACDDSGGSVDGSVKSGDHIMGNPDAPITMIEYASVTCGACAAFHLSVLPQIKEKYIDTGKVQFILREFPTRPRDRAIAAFMLASCMPEERYFNMLDVLFKEQPGWINAVNELGQPDTYNALRKIGLRAGLSNEQVKACIQEDKDEFDRLASVEKDGIKLGVKSTPTFIINGKLYVGGRPFDQMKAIFDPILAEAAAAEQEGDVSE